MPQKQKAKLSNKRSSGSKPDSLTKASKKGDVELTEEELKRVSGGKIKFTKI